MLCTWLVFVFKAKMYVKNSGKQTFKVSEHFYWEAESLLRWMLNIYISKPYVMDVWIIIKLHKLTFILWHHISFEVCMTKFKTIMSSFITAKQKFGQIIIFLHITALCLIFVMCVNVAVVIYWVLQVTVKIPLF